MSVFYCARLRGRDEHADELYGLLTQRMAAINGFINFWSLQISCGIRTVLSPSQLHQSAMCTTILLVAKVHYMLNSTSEPLHYLWAKWSTRCQSGNCEWENWMCLDSSGMKVKYVNHYTINGKTRQPLTSSPQPVSGWMWMGNWMGIKLILAARKSLYVNHYSASGKGGLHSGLVASQSEVYGRGVGSAMFATTTF